MAAFRGSVFIHACWTFHVCMLNTGCLHGEAEYGGVWIERAGGWEPLDPWNRWFGRRLTHFPGLPGRRVEGLDENAVSWFCLGEMLNVCTGFVRFYLLFVFFRLWFCWVSCIFQVWWRKYGSWLIYRSRWEHVPGVWGGALVTPGHLLQGACSCQTYENEEWVTKEQLSTRAS